MNAHDLAGGQVLTPARAAGRHTGQADPRRDQAPPPPATRLLLYLLYRARGRSYTDWYAARMDRRARAVGAAATGSPDTQRFQLDYVVEHGLVRPSDTFLDYGCGTAAAGVHFVRHLEAGRYVGADISAECLVAAKNVVAGSGLEGKWPEFVHLPGGSLDPLRGRRFDVIWAQSVLTHMPPEDVRALVCALVSDHLEPNGVLYASYAVTDGPPRRSHHVKDWFYSFPFFADLAAASGFSVEHAPDWQHPDAGHPSRLLKFARLSTS